MYEPASACNLQHIRWPANVRTNDQPLQQREEILCCFLPAFQESKSIEELQITFPLRNGPSNHQPGAREDVNEYPEFTVSESISRPDGLLER